MEFIPCIVIGGGVVGLAIARAISEQVETCVLEQEKQLIPHTSSRNSGVIHAGIYYPSHFLKTKLCIQGREQLYQYCQEYAIAHQQCGKLIVATNEQQLAQLKSIQQKALGNGVHLNWLDQAQLKQKEPNVQGIAALFSTYTGIIDTTQYAQQLASDILNNGSFIGQQQQVTAIERQDDGFIVEINQNEAIQCRYLVNVGGLFAQSIAHLLACKNIPPIHYCKGQYFSYQGQSPFNHLVYPLPPANNTGLGIHATLNLDGSCKFGPDAHYVEQLDYSVNSDSKADFIGSIQQYFPSINSDLLQADYSGIRPKLAASGQAMQDFAIHDQRHHGISNLINLYGIESPGLTASLAIADYVLECLQE